MATISELIREGTERLAGTSGTARLDAEVLLCEAAGLKKLDLIARKERLIGPEATERFQKFVERRAAGEPVAYIIERKEFFGLDFSVSPAVLVPRPETETLVEEALSAARDYSEPIRLLDLGTGSGCIAISLAAGLKRDHRRFSVVAVEMSAPALEIAAENARRYGLASEIEFRNGNWFDALKPGETFHLIAANPPYVTEGDPAVSPELRYEPPQALYAADGGLSEVMLLAEAAPKYLVPGGKFLCEIGAGQSKELRARFKKSLNPEGVDKIEFAEDLAGHERVLIMQREG